MAASLIGYYPEVNLHYSNIQGSYYKTTDDPHYQQSYDKAFLPPASIPEPKNKPYTPNPEFFGGDLAEFYGKGVSNLNLSGYGLSLAGGEYYGQGLRPSGGRFGTFKLSNIPLPIPENPLKKPISDIRKKFEKPIKHKKFSGRARAGCAR